jgi:hypothetical protein
VNGIASSLILFSKTQLYCDEFGANPVAPLFIQSRYGFRRSKNVGGASWLGRVSKRSVLWRTFDITTLEATGG